MAMGGREEEDLQSPKEHPCVPPRLLSRCLGEACEGVLWGRDKDWGGTLVDAVAELLVLRGADGHRLSLQPE